MGTWQPAHEALAAIKLLALAMKEEFRHHESGQPSIPSHRIPTAIRTRGCSHRLLGCSTLRRFHGPRPRPWQHMVETSAKQRQRIRLPSAERAERDLPRCATMRCTRDDKPGKSDTPRLMDGGQGQTKGPSLASPQSSALAKSTRTNASHAQDGAFDHADALSCHVPTRGAPTQRNILV